jgi:hypothetical protein
MLLLTVSDLGYFYHGFSAATCSRYYLAAPVLKGEYLSSSEQLMFTHIPRSVIQIMISQVIVGYRTWAITRRSKELGIFLLGLGFIVTVFEWYSNVDGRIPVQDGVSFPPQVDAGDLNR